MSSIIDHRPKELIILTNDFDKVFVEYNNNILYPKTLIIEINDDKNECQFKAYMLKYKEDMERYSFGFLLKNEEIVYLNNSVLIVKYDKKPKSMIVSSPTSTVYILKFIFKYSENEINSTYKHTLKSFVVISQILNNNTHYLLESLNSICFITYNMAFDNTEDRDDILKNLDYLYFIMNRVQQVIEKHMIEG